MKSNIDAIFDDMLDNYEEIALEAITDAAYKGQKDIIKEAKKYLQYYYKRKPRMYKRTRNLKRAITPVFEDNTTSSVISITIGVEYDPEPLKGVYFSNSKFHQSGGKWVSRTESGFDWNSGDNGIPEPDYILDNFLMGKHGEAWEDSDYTANLMPSFLDGELQDKLSDYVKNSLFDAIVSRL